MISFFVVSIRHSFSKRGIKHTMKLVLQYLFFKMKRRGFYKLYITELKSNVFLRPGTSDFSVFRQIFMNYEYEFDVTDSPKIIVDAGANIGLSAIYFQNRFPESKIFAVEPDPSNFEVLRLNTEMYKQIRIAQYALWGNNENLNLAKRGLDKWGIQVEPVHKNESQVDETVQGLSIPALMEKFDIERIDLLKIDIEGSEWELFNGRYDEWLFKVKILVIELHEHLRPGCTLLFNNAMNTIRHRRTYLGENIIIYNLDLL